jgi:hypothetical protein
MVKRVIADIVYSGPVSPIRPQILLFGAWRLASCRRFSGCFCKVLPLTGLLSDTPLTWRQRMP